MYDLKYGLAPVDLISISQEKYYPQDQRGTLCSDTCRVSCFVKLFEDPLVSSIALFGKMKEIAIVLIFSH